VASQGEAADATLSLAYLEDQLRELSHDASAVELVVDFASRIPTKQRQVFFSRPGALVRAPIELEEAKNAGLHEEDDDEFQLLQGDIVQTDAAYFLGERVTDALFIVASSSCDLVPGRRKHAALLRLRPIRSDMEGAKQELGNLLSFKSTRRMFIPPLPGFRPEVLAYAADLDGIIAIPLEDLLLATRVASLTLVGWRLFGSLLRGIMVRAGNDEIRLREGLVAIEAEGPRGD